MCRVSLGTSLTHLYMLLCVVTAFLGKVQVCLGIIVLLYYCHIEFEGVRLEILSLAPILLCAVQMGLICYVSQTKSETNANNIIIRMLCNGKSRYSLSLDRLLRLFYKTTCPFEYRLLSRSVLFWCRYIYWYCC
jgi:hypothetical protein